MEYLKAAEHFLNVIISELRLAVQLRDLGTLIASYTTSLDLEFERNMLNATWESRTDDFVIALWTELSFSDHPVLSRYHNKVSNYMGRHYERAASIFRNILAKEWRSVCNRFDCYYVNRVCRCSSPVR